MPRQPRISFVRARRRELAFERLEARLALAAVMVEDINTNPSDGQPDNLVAVGSTLFFTAKEGRFQTPMLWKSDGTAAGTVRVKDIRPRDGAPTIFNGGVALGSTLYFSASVDDVSSLWKSNGTEAGTVVVKSVSVGGLTVVGSTLFFASTDSAGNELWKSDGTTNGTVRVKDIRPGSSGSGPWFPTAAANLLYFVADDGSTGKELWKSDGTEAGTVRVADINTGAAGSDPHSLTVIGNTVYFIATDGTSYKLYKTDGTTTGPVGSVQFPNQLSSTNHALVAAGTNLFFNQNKSELWRTDGTVGGTERIATLPNSQSFITFTQFVSVDSTFYFTALTDASGYELWRSDGTAAGTRLVKDMYPGTHPGLFDSPQHLTRVGNQVYLVSNDVDLWRSDGTEAGTVLVKTFELFSPIIDARPTKLTAAGNQLFLSADDANAGVELWRTDGTVAGTRLVKDVRTGTVGSRVKPLGVANGNLYLNADPVVREIFSNGRYPMLWKSNGTAAGTDLHYETPIITFYNDGFYGVGAIGNNFFFAASIGGGVHHLYVTDGTTTLDLKAGLKARVSTVAGTRLFIGDDELWVSDGTVAGTRQVTEIWPDVFPSTPERLTPFGNGILFTANDGVHGHELWKSDGTAAGTVLVKDIQPGGNWSGISEITVVNGIAYFTAWDGTQTTRPALWRSDGTAAGTFKFADMNAENLFAFGSLLLFAGAGGSTGMELWKSDGTVAGTVLVKNISQFGDSDPGNLIQMGNQVFFTAQPTYQGPIEIWKTNGTDAGTVRVSDGKWGTSVNNIPQGFVSLGNTLFFAAYDGTNGVELWQTDGTAAGTQLAHDIWPGAESSEPKNLIVYQNAVYFSANDGVHGQELWKITAPVATNLPQNPNGRFDVDGNSVVNIDDAVILVRHLRKQAAGGALPTSGPPYLDVSGDGRLLVNDVVEVIKELRRRRSLGNGEGEMPQPQSSASILSSAEADWQSLILDVTQSRKRKGENELLVT